MKPDKQLMIRITEDLYERIAIASVNALVTRQALITKAIEDYLERTSIEK